MTASAGNPPSQLTRTPAGTPPRPRHWSGKPKRSRRRKVLVVALSLLGLLVAGGAVGVLVLQNRLNGNIERIGDPFAELPTRPAVPSPAAGEAKAVNTLMVGSDSRISAGDPAQWAAGAQRTDAIMLVHIPADLGNASLFSIPHDSL